MKRYSSLVWLAVFYAVLMFARPVAAQTIPIQNVQFVGGPAIGSFEETTTITQVDVRNAGVEVHFSKREGPDRWPDIPFGFPGDSLQYSLGIAVNINGQWVANAPIETWFGNTNLGGPITDQTFTCPTANPPGNGQIHCNWFYGERWSPLNTVHPRPGETIGVFVVAGDARNNNNPLRERSNVVTIQLPQPGAEQSFYFAAPAPPPVPVPTPSPIPAPTPAPVPAPLPSTDLSPMLNAVGVVNTLVVELRAELNAHVIAEEAHWDAVNKAWKQVLYYVVPILSALTAGLVKH